MLKNTFLSLYHNTSLPQLVKLLKEDLQSIIKKVTTDSKLLSVMLTVDKLLYDMMLPQINARTSLAT